MAVDHSPALNVTCDQALVVLTSTRTEFLINLGQTNKIIYEKRYGRSSRVFNLLFLTRYKIRTRALLLRWQTPCVYLQAYSGRRRGGTTVFAGYLLLRFPLKFDTAAIPEVFSFEKRGTDAGQWQHGPFYLIWQIFIYLFLYCIRYTKTTLSSRSENIKRVEKSTSQ